MIKNLVWQDTWKLYNDHQHNTKPGDSAVLFYWKTMLANIKGSTVPLIQYQSRPINIQSNLEISQKQLK